MESPGFSITREQGDITSHFTDTNVMDRQPYKRPKSVAIIEDERDIAEIYMRLCLMKGLRVSFVAYDGCKAVEEFKRSVCPDLILIDHRMPFMTGLEAMKKMLDIDPEARFIFLSADEEIKDEAMGAGAKAFMKKPASLGEIYGVMAKVLGEP
jgi:two-component system, chemotaxis family, chemotaxis protein CheY